MENHIEVQQVIYTILKTQIQFGVYQLGERLPTIENAAQLFLVSNDSIRKAYFRLRQEGYITLSKRSGVKIKIQYTEQEKLSHIKAFFSHRRNALLDLSKAMKPLFSQAQCLIFKNASSDFMHQLEQADQPQNIHTPLIMTQHLQLVFSPLKNDLLMRLIWQIFMFYQAPLLSVPGLKTSRVHLSHMVELCRKKDWKELRLAVEASQELLSFRLFQLYENERNVIPSQKQIDFTWSAFKKASQLCYSIAMDILIGINRGLFPIGSYLPSLEKMAKEKQVSVSTIRRTLSVLNDIGAVKSVNGIGTKILSPDEIPKCCDFSQPAIRKRLVDQMEALQIFVLSCKDVAKMTLISLTRSEIEQFKARLHLLRRVNRCELAVYTILELFTQVVPNHAIRKIYSALYQLLLWGYPLRNAQDIRNRQAFHTACFNSFLDCLEPLDIETFALKMEEALTCDFKYVVDKLSELEIVPSENTVPIW